MCITLYFIFINCTFTLHFIYLFKILPHLKMKKMLRTCWYLLKMTLVYLIFQKLIFFILVIFLESTNKLLHECLICKTNNNSYQDNTSLFLKCLLKNPAPFMPLCSLSMFSNFLKPQSI